MYVINLTCTYRNQRRIMSIEQGISNNDVNKTLQNSTFLIQYPIFYKSYKNIFCPKLNENKR
jgi:hypothetical protein